MLFFFYRRGRRGRRGIRLADKIPVALGAPGVATNLPATGILSASLGDSFFCVKLLPILYQSTEGRDGRMT